MSLNKNYMDINYNFNTIHLAILKRVNHFILVRNRIFIHLTPLIKGF